MIVVASRHDHAMLALDKPRVISEIRKNKNNSVVESRPRISGELEWAVDGTWEPRHVEVRDGSLVVCNASAGPELRLPLRHLSLQPANHPRTFSLVREHQSLATLQAGTDEQYERWVKTLAVELMRQTPLDAIRFLDILGITATVARGYEDVEAGCMRRGLSENSLTRTDDSDVSLRNSPEDSLMREDHQPPRGHLRWQEDQVVMDCVADSERGRKKQRVRVSVCGDKRPIRAQSSDPVRKMSDSDSELEDVDENEVAALLRRCQQVDNYVPVREKRRLFESLCRRGRRLAQSSDNLCSTAGVAEMKLRRKKRARSLHDLSRSNVAVREICRYFETRGQHTQDASRHKALQSEGSAGGCNAYLSRRRVQRGERRLTRLKQQAVECEETIWRLQKEMAALDCNRGNTTRSQELRLYTVLEMRLAEEETRLSRLQDDAAHTLREVELATDKFETALVHSSEELIAKNNGRQ